jgi:hypothetical protein
VCEVHIGPLEFACYTLHKADGGNETQAERLDRRMTSIAADTEVQIPLVKEDFT